MAETYPILRPSMVDKDSISQYGGVHLRFIAPEIFVKGVRFGDVFQTQGFSEYSFEDGLIVFDCSASLGNGSVVVSFWRATDNG